MNKYKLINKIAKEGHSFPHGESCNTCIEDFDDVVKFTQKEILKIIDSYIKTDLQGHPLPEVKVLRLIKKQIKDEN